MINGKAKLVGSSDLLNQKSIDDLKQIQETLIDSNTSVDDLQFLIGRDGSIVIADPVRVKLDTPTSSNNKRTIRLLIEAAQENL